MLRLALYEPEIPQNTGTLLRLGACMGVGVDIIEPCGFAFSDRKLRRSGMDYLDLVDYKCHDSWEQFYGKIESQRLVLLTPYAPISYLDFQFQSTDILLLGRESDGVPSSVFAQVPHRVMIPMVSGTRSLNVALAGCFVLGEALRQTGLMPDISQGNGQRLLELGKP